MWLTCTHTHTHTHPFNGPLPRTTRVSRHQKGKTDLDFTEATDSERQWHQLGRMQVCISFQTDNHARTPPLVFYRPDALPAAQPTASKHWRQYDHSQRIDKYLDSWRQITNAADCVAIDHFQKSQSQDGGLPKLLLAYSCLTNHREAASLWLVTPKQVVGHHQWRVVCCNVEYLNFGMQNLCPSNINVIC